MYRPPTLMTAALLLLGIAARAHAAPILVPPGLNPGDPYHLVFVSSTRTTANLGGLTGADALVQSLADAAGIGATQGITWRAILSDSTTDAISRFNPTAPTYDTQGNRVAVNGAALWNTGSVPLENPIAFDETGASGTFIEVWTGSTAAGTLQRADSDWTSAIASDLATSGLALSTGPTWMNALDTAENVPQSIYAASSQLFAPDRAIPEPSTLALVSLGLLVLTGRRRARNSPIAISHPHHLVHHPAIAAACRSHESRSRALDIRPWLHRSVLIEKAKARELCSLCH